MLASKGAWSSTFVDEERPNTLRQMYLCEG